MGAGPLLLKNSQIVLDPLQEGFSPTFAEQRAIRSAIATTQAGKVLLATISAESTPPTLLQTALILQQLGAVDALNLDGGSSAGLYLGGISSIGRIPLPFTMLSVYFSSRNCQSLGESNKAEQKKRSPLGILRYYGNLPLLLS